MAPQEGAIAWIDGWAMPKAAKNVDQVYEFLNYLHTPEVSAAVAEGSGYNPVVDGRRRAAVGAGQEELRRRPIRATPCRSCGTASAEPSWFGELRTQYADKFKSA